MTNRSLPIASSRLIERLAKAHFSVDHGNKPLGIHVLYLNRSQTCALAARDTSTFILNLLPPDRHPREKKSRNTGIGLEVPETSEHQIGSGLVGLASSLNWNEEGALSCRIQSLRLLENMIQVVWGEKPGEPGESREVGVLPCHPSSVEGSDGGGWDCSLIYRFLLPMGLASMADLFLSNDLSSC